MLKAKSKEEIFESLKGLSEKDRIKYVFKHLIAKRIWRGEHPKIIEECLIETSNFLELDYSYSIDNGLFYSNVIRYEVNIYPGHTMASGMFVMTVVISTPEEIE